MGFSLYFVQGQIRDVYGTEILRDENDQNIRDQISVILSEIKLFD